MSGSSDDDNLPITIRAHARKRPPNPAFYARIKRERKHGSQSDDDDDWAPPEASEPSEVENISASSEEELSSSEDSECAREIARGSKKKIQSVGKPVVKISEDEPDQDICSACQFGGADNMLLLCDGDACEHAFHTFCLIPPLESIPDGDWFCPYCTKPSKQKKSIKTYPMRKVGAVLGRRSTAEGIQYLVKWESLSHRHDTWVPEEWLLFRDRAKLHGFQKKYPLCPGSDQDLDLRSPDWCLIDRIIAAQLDGETISDFSSIDNDRVEFLVKWVNVDYDGATWENRINAADFQEAVSNYIGRHLRMKEILEEKVGVPLALENIVEQPKYLTGGELHPFQLEGLKWLLGNYFQGTSAILADEMGLGKTIQTIAFMVCLKQERAVNKPFLVIVPKSTLSGWRSELTQWAPNLNSVVYEGSKESRNIIQKYELLTDSKEPLIDVLVTSYELAMIDNSMLRKCEWSSIIVDEGHRVKNFRCKLVNLLKKQKSDHRLLLTGTPVQNTLTELFALLNFVDPTQFPDPEQAAKEFGDVERDTGLLKEDQHVQQTISRLHDLLQPRMLRRLKTEVLRNMLPGKKLIEVPCSLTTFQRGLYCAILKKNHKVLNRGVDNGRKRSLLCILADLKMCCNHPFLFPSQEPQNVAPEEGFEVLVKASGKLQLLEKLLPRLKDGGHRVLLFSQMTKMLDIIEDFLNFLAYSFFRIDGNTSSSERQKLIQDFNHPHSSTFIFLISTRAGGLGINLPTADTVIIYDPDFNPFVDLQAQSRAHRIGQEKVVLVYQLITKYSIEEKIMQRARQKLAMENLVMQPDTKATAQELNDLLLHGARQILDEHDAELTALNYSDDDIDALLNRDLAGSEEDRGGYLGSVQIKQFGPKSDPSEDASNNHTTAGGKIWEELLGRLVDKNEEEEELGRGKRPRNTVNYSNESGEEDDEYRPSSSESSSSSESVDGEELGSAYSMKVPEVVQAATIDLSSPTTVGMAYSMKVAEVIDLSLPTSFNADTQGMNMIRNYLQATCPPERAENKEAFG